MVLGFLIAGFRNLSGGPRETRPMAQPGQNGGAGPEQRGTPPDSFPGSLSGQHSDSPGGQAPMGLSGGMDQLTRNGHKIR